MGDTLKVLKRNRGTAKKQNGEPPRDLALLEALDAFVNHRMSMIDYEATQKALQEYTQWIKNGYSLGKLGIKHEPALVTRLKDEVKELKEEREGLKKDVAELRKEVEGHKKIREWIRLIFARLLAIPLLEDAIRRLPKAWPVFEELAEAIGVNLSLEPSRQTDVVAKDLPKSPRSQSLEQQNDIT